VYVNCWKKDTSFKIVTNICEQIGYKWVHNKRTDELMRTIAEMANKKAIVIVLDEVDKVKEVDILYSLAEDLNRKTLLLVANDKNWIANLDTRVKSRLNLELMKFEPYNFNETRGIMKYRRDSAFVDGVWDEEGFDLIASKAYDMKDIRAGLYLLKEAGSIAESFASRKISLEHSKKAVTKMESFKIKKVDDFGEEERKVLELIRVNSGKTIKDLFEIYERDGGVKSYRTFHRKIEELKDNKMIDFEGKEGKSIVVKYSKKLNEF
jgi:Cdc6-like AAA superfamily ATPase